MRRTKIWNQRLQKAGERTHQKVLEVFQFVQPLAAAFLVRDLSARGSELKV